MAGAHHHAAQQTTVLLSTAMGGVLWSVAAGGGTREQRGQGRLGSDWPRPARGGARAGGHVNECRIYGRNRKRKTISRPTGLSTSPSRPGTTFVSGLVPPRPSLSFLPSHSPSPPHEPRSLSDDSAGIPSARHSATPSPPASSSFPAHPSHLWVTATRLPLRESTSDPLIPRRFP